MKVKCVKDVNEGDGINIFHLFLLQKGKIFNIFQKLSSSIILSDKLLMLLLKEQKIQKEKCFTWNYD